MEANVLNVGFRSMPQPTAVSPPEAPTPLLANPETIWTLSKAALIVILFGLLFGRVLADMARDWWTEPAWSQGILLPPLALYIAWIHRTRILAIPEEPDIRGVLLTFAGCCLYVLGRLASEFFLTRISFVILLAAFVWTFWGRRRFQALAFPLLLLATMVPLPALIYNSVAAPLQLLASDVANRVLQALGVAVFRDGNIIHLAGISLGVAEACSGLNSLSALIVGSVLLGFLCCSRPASRALLFLSAIPIAIGINVLRVAGTAILADHNQDWAEGFYHLFSGWLVFLAGFGLLYSCARLVHAVIDHK